MNKIKSTTGVITTILSVLLLGFIVIFIVRTNGLQHDALLLVTPADSLTEFTYEIENGESGVAELPYDFKNLEPNTKISVYMKIEAGKYESLLVKTVYSGLKLYADDILIYECGQPDSYPDWLLDPPTLLGIVSLPQDATNLRFEYISPSQRDTMSVHTLMAGSDGSLLSWLFNKNAVVLIFSIILLFVGLAVLIITIGVWHGEKPGGAFFYLGIFALVAGCWGFGECNATAFIVPYPILLYLMSMLGLFMIIIPLLRFALVVLTPHRPQILQVASAFMLVLVIVALGLQLLGIVSFSKVLYIFQILEILGLLLFFGTAIWEYFHYHNQTAKKFTLPSLILLLASIIEYINYSVRFTNVLSLFFMMGTLLFTIGLGVIALQYSRDTLREVEEKKRLAVENAALERMNKLKTDLMITISHEARTPLAVLASYAGLVSMELRNKNADTQMASDLDKIAFEAKRVAGLIQSMKIMTLNAEHTKERITLNLGELISQTVHLYEPILERQEVRVILDIDSELPTIIGNPDELTQVLFNLLQNAKNHTKHGEVNISVKSDDEKVIVIIADTGQGIDPELLPHVFQRGVSTTTEGSGLGLAICQELIKAHNGEIHIESNYGEGTIVTITIPVE